ncbi:MAG: hypothetical protein WC700_09090 [Gemmatimonadaceae bacterium]|jgi:hypothetical protein
MPLNRTDLQAFAAGNKPKLALTPLRGAGQSAEIDDDNAADLVDIEDDEDDEDMGVTREPAAITALVEAAVAQVKAEERAQRSAEMAYQLGIMPPWVDDPDLWQSVMDAIMPTRDEDERPIKGLGWSPWRYVIQTYKQLGGSLALVPEA